MSRTVSTPPAPEKKTMLDGREVNITDPNSAPTCVPTILTETRLVAGVLYLSLAETIVDADQTPEIRVCTRLRLDTVFAQQLRDTLDRMIQDATKPADTSKAN